MQRQHNTTVLCCFGCPSDVVQLMGPEERSSEFIAIHTDFYLWNSIFFVVFLDLSHLPGGQLYTLQSQSLSPEAHFLYKKNIWPECCAPKYVVPSMYIHCIITPKTHQQKMILIIYLICICSFSVFKEAHIKSPTQNASSIWIYCTRYSFGLTFPTLM